MTIPTQEEIDKIKDELLECVQRFKRDCECSWSLIERLYHKDGKRNIVHVSRHMAEGLHYKNGALKLLAGDLDLDIEVPPQVARKLARKILLDTEN